MMRMKTTAFHRSIVVAFFLVAVSDISFTNIFASLYYSFHISLFLYSSDVCLFHSAGLMERFNSFLFQPYNGTPTADVASLLLKTLQKVPNVAQSHASDILPLLLKFMGYNTENPMR